MAEIIILKVQLQLKQLFILKLVLEIEILQITDNKLVTNLAVDRWAGIF